MHASARRCTAILRLALRLLYTSVMSIWRACLWLVFSQSIAGAAQVEPPPSPPLPASNVRKAALLERLGRSLESSTAPFSGRGTLVEIRGKLAALPPGAVQKSCMLRASLGDALLGFGQIEEAIEEYGRCVEDAIATRAPRAIAAANRKLALGWLRLGERNNCVTRHNQDSCLFPLKDGALHVDRTGSEKGIEFLMKALAADSNDLASVWLLNVAHMTLGSWPDAVPEPWRIPRRAVESERAMPRMFDVAPTLGLHAPARAGGSVVDDFDGDGQLEVVMTSVDFDKPMRFFRRQASGEWLDVAESLGIAKQVGALNLVQFDANNDGRLDLLLQRGAWLGDFGRLPNSLLVQQPDGTFVDRTQEAGMEFTAPSQVVAVADIELDGDMDIFLGYENVGGERAIRYPCRLLRNRGDGTFEEIQQQAGVSNGRFTKGAAFGDYDGDGLPDLYVSNLGGPNRLYHNEGGGRFKDVAAELGVEQPRDGFSCWFFDYNNDGWLDLFVGCYDAGDRSAQLAAYYRDGTVPSQTQKLYENDGHGRFRDVTVERRLDRVAFPMGSNFGDIDNDGFLDIYLATGDPELSSLWPNVLHRNDGGRRFEEVTVATGTGHLQKGHGVSFGDLDGDGDQDLFVKLGGAAADDGFASALFENPTQGAHWLTVRLIGRTSNRFAVGTRLKVTLEEGGKQRDVFHFVGANSSFGGNSLQAEIGLGAAARIVALEASWPQTRQVQRFVDVPLDRVVVLDEGRADLEVLPVAPVRSFTPPVPPASDSGH